MQESSANNLATESAAVRKTLAATEIRWHGRLLLLALNFLPLLHASLPLSLWFLVPGHWPERMTIALAALYLLPPLAARLLLIWFKMPTAKIEIGSRAFYVWWMSFQLQVVFCRLPVLEEILRLVPGLYSCWLRLWGSRIGRLTYWSPGTTITDRSFLRIGHDVVFGAGVRLNAHVLRKNPAGRLELLLAPLKIGDRSIVGGYSLLTAGTEIGADEATQACQLFSPFSVCKNGRRSKPAHE